MTQSDNATRLNDTSEVLEILPDPGVLRYGRVRLMLEGRYRCNNISLPFYKFTIQEDASGSAIGEITFTPTHDAERVREIGHFGGGLNSDARGRGLYGDALKALLPLAARFGMDGFTFVIPSANKSARQFATKSRYKQLNESPGVVERYFVTAASG